MRRQRQDASGTQAVSERSLSLRHGRSAITGSYFTSRHFLRVGYFLSDVCREEGNVIQQHCLPHSFLEPAVVKVNVSSVPLASWFFSPFSVLKNHTIPAGKCSWWGLASAFLALVCFPLANLFSSLYLTCENFPGAERAVLV